MLSCIEQDLWALVYSLTVYLFLIESTVLIMTCAVSFLTPEKYKPFLRA